MKDNGIPTVWTRVDGQRTRYRMVPPVASADDGAVRLVPLLLLHGLGCSSDAWRPTLRVLASRRLPQGTYAPDFPGCGRSRCAGGARDMSQLADWTVRFLDILGVERAHVAGNSMGCQVAMAMARRHPARVGGLVLLGPTTGSSLVPFWRYALGLLLDGFGESLRYNVILLKMYLQMGLPRYLATVRLMMKDDPVALCDRVRAPVLVVRGGHDRIVSPRTARELAASLPRGEYQALDSTAHAAEFNTPGLFVAALLEFLARAEKDLPLVAR